LPDSDHRGRLRASRRLDVADGSASDGDILGHAGGAGLECVHVHGDAGRYRQRDSGEPQPGSCKRVGVGLGTPSGTTACTLTSSTANATAASTPQITVTQNLGTFCVKVFDTGNLTTA
jgi:hypothetical protein